MNHIQCFCEHSPTRLKSLKQSIKMRPFASASYPSNCSSSTSRVPNRHLPTFLDQPKTIYSCYHWHSMLPCRRMQNHHTNRLKCGLLHTMYQSRKQFEVHKMSVARHYKKLVFHAGKLAISQSQWIRRGPAIKSEQFHELIHYVLHMYTLFDTTYFFLYTLRSHNYSQSQIYETQICQIFGYIEQLKNALEISHVKVWDRCSRISYSRTAGIHYIKRCAALKPRKCFLSSKQWSIFGHNLTNFYHFSHASD